MTAERLPPTSSPVRKAHAWGEPLGAVAGGRTLDEV